MLSVICRGSLRQIQIQLKVDSQLDSKKVVVERRYTSFPLTPKKELHVFSSDEAPFGSIQVAELDWGNQEHVRGVKPPFDYIIGTDVVYAEHLLEPLLQTIFSLSGPRTTILMCSEIRSTTVHEQMIHMWNSNFDVKTVSKSKMDRKYQHPSIQLYIMGLKTQSWHEEAASTDFEVNGFKKGIDENSKASGSKEWDLDHSEDEILINGKAVLGKDNDNLDDWEARRYGSMAARLLKDVSIA